MIYEDHLQVIAEGRCTDTGLMAQKALNEVKALMRKPIPPWEQPEFVAGVNTMVEELIEDGYLKVEPIKPTFGYSEDVFGCGDDDVL